MQKIGTGIFLFFQFSWWFIWFDYVRKDDIVGAVIIITEMYQQKWRQLCLCTRIWLAKNGAEQMCKMSSF